MGLLRGALRDVLGNTLRGVLGDTIPPEPPVGLPRGFTPRYKGSTYIQFDSVWQNTGPSWRVIATFINPSWSNNRAIIDGSSDGYVSRFILYESGGIKGLETWTQNPDSQNRFPNELDLSGEELQVVEVNSSGEIILNGNIIGNHSGTEMRVSRIGLVWVDIWFFIGQIQRLELIDESNAENTIIINPNQDEDTPTTTDIFNDVDGLRVAEIVGFDGYEPCYAGGGLNGEKVPDKYEAWNGQFTSGDYVKGIRVIGGYSMTQLAQDYRVGSWVGDGVSISQNKILIGTRGSVSKTIPGSSTNTVSFNLLQGTETDMLNDLQYPNVFRVLENDGGTDNTSEYYYYNNGGTYPWNPDLYSAYDAGYSDGYL